MTTSELQARAERRGHWRDQRETYTSARGPPVRLPSMYSVTATASLEQPNAWSPVVIRLAEIHTLQVFAATRIELAVERARDLLGASSVATSAALEIADLLRRAAAAAARSAVAAQELRREFARREAARLGSTAV